MLLACCLGMDDRRILLLSILDLLVRCLLGLAAMLVQRDLSKDAELLALRHETTVCAERWRGALHARRPSVAGRFISARATLPLGRNLPDDPRHDPGLAPQALAQVRLPTFEVAGHTLVPRLTLIMRDRLIEHV